MKDVALFDPCIEKQYESQWPYRIYSEHVEKRLPNATKTNPRCQLKISVVSFNILAESYLTKKSHPNLPPMYQNVVFSPKKRRSLLMSTLTKLSKAFHENEKTDILCLQEVDLFQEINEHMNTLGYTGIKTEREERVDSCCVFWNKEKFDLIEYKLVNFDDVTKLSLNGKKQEKEDKSKKERKKERRNKPQRPTELTGLVQSFIRRNTAVIIVLELRNSPLKEKVLISSLHLYWNPNYEYVKLAQVKYLLNECYQISRKFYNDNVPIILCGDFNSKPNSFVYNFITDPPVDARILAPWYYWPSEKVDDGEILRNSDKEKWTQIENHSSSTHIHRTMQIGTVLNLYFYHFYDHLPLLCHLSRYCTRFSLFSHKIGQNSFYSNNFFLSAIEKNLIKFSTDKKTDDSIEIFSITTKPKYAPFGSSSNEGEDCIKEKSLKQTSEPKIRYIVDFTLNKFSRWLRMFGIDTALETEEEERERTSGSTIPLFDRAYREHRSLVTTSYKLVLRKECPPGTYLINPSKDVQEAFCHLLLTHGIILEPSNFLTRCVVCNAEIEEVEDEKTRVQIFQANRAPVIPELAVYRCLGCKQGYWWSDQPNSSASRVKNAVTYLFKLALEYGVPYKGDLDMFDFIEINKIQKKEFRSINSESLSQVLFWLRDDSLSHQFQLISAYCDFDNFQKEKKYQEILPFTNVTDGFVGTLDYIFYEPKQWVCTHRLKVPTTFQEMNVLELENGNFIPSNMWPSDHLAVGCRLEKI